MDKLRMLKKKKFLTLLVADDSAYQNCFLDSFLELALFLVRYEFILSENKVGNYFLKRDFTPPGELFSQNSNGARYLDAKYSRWMSTDPALGEYMSGSDAGCGGIYNPVNMSLYHYGGNNPIKYVDPTGCDDLYYDGSGNYIETIKTKTSDVYRSINGSVRKIGSQADFETMTAALYGETDENNYTLEEMQAIGDVIMNRAKCNNTSASVEIKAPGQVNGYYENDSQGVTSRGRTSNNNARLKTARNAAMTTMLGESKGKSNGAYYWDGADIAYNIHNKEGIHYTNSAHDIYNTGDTKGGPYVNYWTYSDDRPPKLRGTCDQKYYSTAAFGGTVFWRLNPEYKSIMGAKDFNR